MIPIRAKQSERSPDETLGHEASASARPAVARRRRNGEQLPLPLERDVQTKSSGRQDGAGLVRAPRSLRGDAPGRQVRLPRVGVSKAAVDELRLQQALLGFLPPGKGLSVTLTENRHTMVAVKRAQAGYGLRLHRMFLGAEPRMLRAIARYVVHNDRRASSLLSAFIEANQHVISTQPRAVRRVILRTKGRAHDLQAIFDRLNVDHFGGTLDARITWGPALRKQRPRRSIKMGSFAVEDRLIRIHPLLDSAAVPEYFVSWIVFHEMLHGKHEVVRSGGRRCFHTKAFLAEERSFPDYQRACVWERANIDRLLG